MNKIKLELSGKHLNSLNSFNLNKENEKEKEKEIIFITLYQINLYNINYNNYITLFSFKIIELNLFNCSLINCSFISNFNSLKYLNLSNNKIEIIPENIILLTKLQFFDISNNYLNSILNINLLNNIKSLIYLNLSNNNNITKLNNYRSIIIEKLSNLIGLDLYYISDEERYYKYCKCQGTRYATCSKRLYIEPSLRKSSYPKKSRKQLQRFQLFRKNSFLKLAYSSSPIRIIQRNCKKWLKYSCLIKYIKPIIKLQAYVRSFLLKCKIKNSLKQLECNNIIEFNREFHLIHYGYVTKFVILIQRQWRICLKYRKEIKAIQLIKKWYRKAKLYHKGAIRWLKNINAKGIIFPTKYSTVITNILLKLIKRLSPNGITYNLLKSITNSIQPVSRIVIIRSKRKIVELNYEKTLRIEFLFLHTPPSKILSTLSNNNEITSSNKVNSTKTQVLSQSLQSSSNKLISQYFQFKIIYFSSCLSYANNYQRKLLFLLKRRGCCSTNNFQEDIQKLTLERIIKNSRGEARQTLLSQQEKKYSFWTKSLSLSQITFDNNNISLMWKIYKYLRYNILEIEDIIPLYFDTQMKLQSSIIEIQRIWRGYISRKLKSKAFIEKIIEQRARIVIQRWWRYHNNIKRRFDLLRFINLKCHEIKENKLYLDTLVYYQLLRVFHRPEQTPLNTFPEYRGIPLIDNKTGNLYLQPLIKNLNNENISMIKQSIPIWCSWRPLIQKSPIKETSSKNNYHNIIRNLISSHCSIAIEHFPLISTIQSNSSMFPDFRMIELVFSSVSEAKIRCAMLMLQTYDCITRSCVAMMTSEYVLNR